MEQINKIESQTLSPLIGGIKVSDEEKVANLNEIKEAIIKNNQGHKATRISNISFAKSYPESLELVKEYYDSLYYAEIANAVGWNGKHYTDKNKLKKSYKYYTNNAKLETLVIFAPELIDKEVIELKNRFDISINEVAFILNNYKKIMKNVSKTADLDEEQEKYHIAKIIYEEIVINGMEKQTLCEKYRISDQSLTHHIELLKEIDKTLYDEVQSTLENNKTKRYYSLKELALKIGTYYKEKITINTESGEIKMPFTMLDYYFITNCSPDELIEFINNRKNFNSNINTKEELMYKSCAKNFLQSNKIIGSVASKETILKKRMAAGTLNNMVQINEVIYDELIDLFEEEGIPKYTKLIEIAFNRYALGKPILPLRLTETENKLEEETHLIKTLKP